MVQGQVGVSVVQGLQDVVQLGWGAPLLPEIEKKILEIATICTAIVLRSAVFMRSFRIFLGQMKSTIM